MSTMRLTRDQERAAYAYARVEELVREARGDGLEYATLVQAFGPMVLRNGLLVALADLERRARAKGPTAASRFCDHLGGAAVPGLGPFGPSRAARGLVEQTRAMSLEDYMLATREAIAVAAWFTRAVQALIARDGT